MGKIKMDEEQLREIKNLLSSGVEEADRDEESSASVKKIIEYAIAGLAIGFIITASGFYLWVKLHQGYESIEIYNKNAQALP